MTLREIAGLGFLAAGCACIVVAVWLEPAIAEALVEERTAPRRRPSMRVPWTKGGDA